VDAICLRFKEKATPEVLDEFRSELFALCERRRLVKSMSSFLKVELNSRILDSLKEIADQEEKLARYFQDASGFVVRASDDALANKVMHKQIASAASNCIRMNNILNDKDAIKELEEYFCIDPISLASVLHNVSERFGRNASRYREIIENGRDEFDKVLEDKFPSLNDAINVFSSFFYINTDEEVLYAKSKKFSDIDARPVGLIKTSSLVLKDFCRKVFVFDSNRGKNYFSFNTATVATMLACHISPESSIFRKAVQDESFLEIEGSAGNSLMFGANASSLMLDSLRSGLGDLDGAITQVRVRKDEEYRLDEIDGEINDLFDRYFLQGLRTRPS
jgi:hypothetical protein